MWIKANVSPPGWVVKTDYPEKRVNNSKSPLQSSVVSCVATTAAAVVIVVEVELLVVVVIVNQTQVMIKFVCIGW